MNKLVVVAVAAVLLVVAVLAAIVYLPGLTASKTEVTGDVKVYVEDATTGNMMGATVKFGQETFGEQMMLAFGMGIRQTSFQPLFTANVTGINPTAAYNVWVAASINIVGVNLTSLTSSAVTFTGTSGASGHPSLLYGGYITDNSVSASNKLVVGKTTSVDMFADAGKKWNNVWASPATTVSVGSTRTLVGSDLNGMVVNVTVQATGSNGVTSTVVQHLTISASYTSPSLTITVTGITVTGPPSTVISPFKVETLATTTIPSLVEKS